MQLVKINFKMILEKFNISPPELKDHPKVLKLTNKENISVTCEIEYDLDQDVLLNAKLTQDDKIIEVTPEILDLIQSDVANKSNPILKEIVEKIKKGAYHE